MTRAKLVCIAAFIILARSQELLLEFEQKINGELREQVAKLRLEITELTSKLLILMTL
jgi:hypothetical protein